MENSTVKLRTDLQVLPLSGDRDCVIVDDIGGRFARAKRSLWVQLQISSQSGDRDARLDPSLRQQAVTAGWTQSRLRQRGTGWSPLSIRIPIASMDPIARRLLPWSDYVFAPKAIFLWIAAAVIGIAMLIIRWEQWSGSVPSLTKYIASMTPWSVAAMFVVTKTIHELGHAVACRRLGSRCGVAGVWLLCGMPCPYVDVTEVWRQPNPMRRASVMAAGMIAEGVVCVLAVWVWVLADSAAVRLASMNVILVCGVSTVLFNANPLMRYDGYFILSDLLDSTNLRGEAGKAAMRLISLPMMRWRREGMRVGCLAVYHVASAGYRVLIFIAIASMILAVADQWHLWRLALAVVLAMTVISMVRISKGGYRMFRGEGKWSVVPEMRRRLWCLGGCLAVVGILVVPIPRYRSIDGRIEARDAIAIYMPGEGIIDEVYVRVGDPVRRDQTLACLVDRELAMQIISVEAQDRILVHRWRASRLASLSNFRPSSRKPGRSPDAAPESQWGILEEASVSARKSRDDLIARRNRLNLTSPADGIVLRNAIATSGSAVSSAVNTAANTAASTSVNSAANTTGDSAVGPFVFSSPGELSPGVGELPDERNAWCRIATSSELRVSIPLAATDHDEIQIGCPIRLTIPGRSTQVFRCRIVAVSPLRAGADETTHDDTHTYHAIANVETDPSLPLVELPQWDGAAAHVVAHLPRRALWRDLVEMAREVVGVELALNELALN